MKFRALFTFVFAFLLLMVVSPAPASAEWYLLPSGEYDCFMGTGPDEETITMFCVPVYRYYWLDIPLIYTVISDGSATGSTGNRLVPEIRGTDKLLPACKTQLPLPVRPVRT